MSKISIYYNNYNDELQEIKDEITTIISEKLKPYKVDFVSADNINSAINAAKETYRSSVLITIEFSSIIGDRENVDTGVIFMLNHEEFPKEYNTISTVPMKIVNRKTIYTKNNVDESYYFVINTGLRKEDYIGFANGLSKTIISYLKIGNLIEKMKGQKRPIYYVKNVRNKVVICTSNREFAFHRCNMVPGGTLYEGDTKIYSSTLTKIDPLSLTKIASEKRVVNKKPLIKKRRIGGSSNINKF